jgi:hypothetical protein
MPNRTEARPAKAVLTYVTGSLPLLRLFSTPLIIRVFSGIPYSRKENNADFSSPRICNAIS